MEHKNIQEIGPGIWFEIHEDAATSTSPLLGDLFVQRMKRRAERFPCDKCRPHFIKYLETHPIECNTAEERLKWTYFLHSTVNKRLGKINPSWEEVKNYYMGDRKCDGFCLGEIEISKPSTAYYYQPPTHTEVKKRKFNLISNTR